MTVVRGVVWFILVVFDPTAAPAGVAVLVAVIVLVIVIVAV